MGGDVAGGVHDGGETDVTAGVYDSVGDASCVRAVTGSWGTGRAAVKGGGANEGAGEVEEQSDAIDAASSRTDAECDKLPDCSD